MLIYLCIKYESYRIFFQKIKNRTAPFQALKKKKRPYFSSLNSKCDLDLRATDLGFAHDTMSHDGQHFCHVILKSIKEWQSYEPDTKKDPIFDLWPRPWRCRPGSYVGHIFLWWSTFLPSDFKSIEEWLTCGPDTEKRPYFCPLSVILTLEL